MCKESCVAPLVGAWIEIYGLNTGIPMTSVAPLVGAWIEIKECNEYAKLYRSLPSWERGLKSNSTRSFTWIAAVAPLVGAWIEIS